MNSTMTIDLSTSEVDSKIGIRKDLSIRFNCELYCQMTQLAFLSHELQSFSILANITIKNLGLVITETQGVLFVGVGQSITDEVIFDFEGEQYRLNISDQTDFLYRVMEAKAEALQII